MAENRESERIGKGLRRKTIIRVGCFYGTCDDLLKDVAFD